MSPMSHGTESLRAPTKELAVLHSPLSHMNLGKMQASNRLAAKMVGNPGRNSIAVHHVFGYNSRLVGESSSGRTADSGSVSGGSNPSSPATSSIGTQVSGQTASGKTKGEGQRLPLKQSLWVFNALYRKVKPHLMPA